jgi:hypothetical protein
VRVVLYFIGVLTSMLLSQAATACPHSDICRHIRHCLKDLTEKNRADRELLIQVIKAKNGSDIRTVTDRCQINIGDVKNWRGDESQCSNDEVRAAGVNALERECNNFPEPPTPAPIPFPDPGNTMNTCELPSGISCPTTAPVGSSCFCGGEPGRSHK